MSVVSVFFAVTHNGVLTVLRQPCTTLYIFVHVDCWVSGHVVFAVVQLPSPDRLFATPCTAARQVPLAKKDKASGKVWVGEADLRVNRTKLRSLASNEVTMVTESQGLDSKFL